VSDKPPVVLVHGTFEDMTISWNALSPVLRGQGYCPWALDYGGRATGRVPQSADEVAAFVDQVLATTGAAKVSYVGHSQGGMLGRYIALLRGKAAVLDDVIGIAPSSHGTESPLAPPVAIAGDCPACADQVAGSPVMQELAAAGEAPPPPAYTVIATRYDEVVTPFTTQALQGATNVVVQDACPGDLSEHVGLQYDPVAIQWVLNALARSGPANPAFEPDCTGLTFGTDPGPDAAAPPAGSPPPAAAPARLRVVRKRVRVRGHRATVRVSCRAPQGRTCLGRVELRAGGRRVGRRPVRVGAGRRATVRVQVRRASTHRRVRARAVLVAVS
jgi:triacylglycerol lipase